VSGDARTVRCLVAGRVQGVFYRAATAREARDLGLCGWAKNLPDGRVEVLARGSADAVAALCAWLWQGPPAAEVEQVTVEHSAETVAIEENFRIL
jgi:acylphosphatase